ncbi:MAG: ribosome biogenesis GTP-binding protein YihA/YsxC [Burkholderiales bacterium]
MNPFDNAVFFASAYQLAELPPDSGAEVAFAGRSNVGKSSAINALTNRTRLAFSSKTPGRTQTINFFALGNGRHLVDLPGYGYAAVSADVKKHWGLVVSTYLRQRNCLNGLVLLMDARHPMTATDRQLIDWFAPTGRGIHILLTKADKLRPAAGRRVLRDVSAQLPRHHGRCTAQLFSSRLKEGVDEARAVVAGWLDPAAIR